MAYNFPTQQIEADLYAQRLGSALRPGSPTLTVETATRQEYEIWQTVQQDAGVAHAFNFMRRMIIGKDYKVVAGGPSKEDRDAAAIMGAIFRKCRNLRKFLYAISEFPIRGESYGYPNYDVADMDPLNQGFSLSWTYPYEILQVDRFRIKKFNTEDGGLRFQIFSQITNGWRDLEEDEIENFLYFNNSQEEYRMSYGMPLLEAVYWMWYIKKIVQGEMLNLSERFGQGMLVAKIENLKLGSPDRELQAYADEVLEMLARMKAKHVGVCGKQEEITVVEPSATGYQILKEIVDYCDSKILTLCLGSNSVVSESQQGSYAERVVFQDNSYQYIGYDRSVVDEEMTSYMQRLWDLNYWNFKALGLEDAALPEFKIVGHRNDTPINNLEILRGAYSELKLPLVFSEVYELLGLTQPVFPSEDEEGDEILWPDGLGPQDFVQENGEIRRASKPEEPEEVEEEIPEEEEEAALAT